MVSYRVVSPWGLWVSFPWKQNLRYPSPMGGPSIYRNEGVWFMRNPRISQINFGEPDPDQLDRLRRFLG